MANQKYWEIEDPSLVEDQKIYAQTPDGKPLTTQSKKEQVDDFWIDFGGIGASILYVWKMFVVIVVSIILIILFYKLLRYLLAFLYDVLNINRYVWLRITLPRWDTKVDREKTKEIAKDMKEKIWRMAQVYRHLHKLWELTVWDNIMNFFFEKPKLTFALHYEKGLLYFIVWVYPEYKTIVEGAIAAQYSEVSIETIKPFSYWFYNQLNCKSIFIWNFSNSIQYIIHWIIF